MVGIINHLNINMLIGTKNRQTRAFCGASEPTAHPLVPTTG
jgi:hypothetical protein